MRRGRRYQPLSTSIWDDDKIRAMSTKDEDARTLFIYLLTCKHANLPGLFIMPKMYIANDLRWTLERVTKGLRNPCLMGMIVFDEPSETVLLLNYFKHRPLDNPNKVIGAAQAIEEIPKSPLFPMLLSRIEMLELKGYETLIEALRNRCKTLPQPESVSETESVPEAEPETVPVTPGKKPGAEREYPDSVHYLCKQFEMRRRSMDPKFKPKSKLRWLADMDKLMRIDGRGELEIDKTMAWAINDKFWGSVIMSPGNLREHFQQIRTKMLNAGNWKGTKFERNMAAIDRAIDDAEKGKSHGGKVDNSAGNEVPRLGPTGQRDN